MAFPASLCRVHPKLNKLQPKLKVKVFNLDRNFLQHEPRGGVQSDQDGDKPGRPGACHGGLPQPYLLEKRSQ